MKYVEVGRRYGISLVVVTRVASLDRATMRSEEVRNANDDRDEIDSLITDKWQIFQYCCLLRINHCHRHNKSESFCKNQHLLNSLLWETIHITQKSEKQVGRSFT